LASRPLRIGTRGSPMALRQTAIIRDRLIAAHPELAAAGAVEIMTIRTTGDRVQHRLLAEIGGKGVRQGDRGGAARWADRSGAAFAEGHGDLLPVGLGPEAETRSPESRPFSPVRTTAGSDKFRL
jgi:Porphobilinogen deaminase, dipyromethane cofactor binding domain